MLRSRRLAAVTIALVALYLHVAGVLVSAQEAPELQINSTRYIVIDAETGNVFAQRGANDRVAIASVTKVFTAVQAMEMAPLDTPITTADYDLRAPGGEYFGSNGTLMGFGAGETYTLEDMLYGMLLPSGNDAANAIARNLGAREGDSDEEAVAHFMDLLNQRVADMGLENTQFVNPHGWGEEGHYSSAADIAAFSRMLVNYSTLMEIMGTSSYTTSNGEITVTNTNRSLNLYPSVVGGKTGYDWDSGYCLVNIARRDDALVIAVTLDGVAPDDWYDDNATLLDYGFDQREALLASGESFSGDVAAFTDPSAAQVARSVEPGGSFAAAPSDTAGEPAQPADDPVVPPASAPGGEPVSEPEQLARSGSWVGVVVGAGLILAGGWRAWSTFVRTRPHRLPPRVREIASEPQDTPASTAG